MKQNITAIVLTYNEQLHIERCVRNLKQFANDVVIIDSFSTDDTVEIAKKLGARVFQNPWVNHSVQFNWALDNVEINAEWIIRVDADEYLEDPKGHIHQTLATAAKHITGLALKRKYLFMGKWIKHGGMYPIETLRMFRNGKGRVEHRLMDEHIVLSEGECRTLDADIVDDNLNSISWWIEKHNGYATKEMLETINLTRLFMNQDRSNREHEQHTKAKWKRAIKEKVYARMPLFVRPVLYFMYRYFILLGFMDGNKGFAFHFMQGLWYRCLVDLKVLESKSWLRSVDKKTPDEIRKVLSIRTGLRLD